MVVGIEEPAGIDTIALKEGPQIEIAGARLIQFLQEGIGSGVSVLRHAYRQQVLPPLDLLGRHHKEIGNTLLLQRLGQIGRSGGVGLHALRRLGGAVRLDEVQCSGGQLDHGVFIHRVLHHPAAGDTLDAAVELDEQMVPVQILIDGGLRLGQEGSHILVLGKGLEQGFKAALPPQKRGEQQHEAPRHQQQEQAGGYGIASFHWAAPCQKLK